MKIKRWHGPLLLICVWLSYVALATLMHKPAVAVYKPWQNISALHNGELIKVEGVLQGHSPTTIEGRPEIMSRLYDSCQMPVADDPIGLSVVTPDALYPEELATSSTGCVDAIVTGVWHMAPGGGYLEATKILVKK